MLPDPRVLCCPYGGTAQAVAELSFKRHTDELLRLSVH